MRLIIGRPDPDWRTKSYGWERKHVEPYGSIALLDAQTIEEIIRRLREWIVTRGEGK